MENTTRVPGAQPLPCTWKPVFPSPYAWPRVSLGVVLVPLAGVCGGSAPGGGMGGMGPAVEVSVAASPGSTLGPTYAPPMASTAAPRTIPDTTTAVRACGRCGRCGTCGGRLRASPVDGLRRRRCRWLADASWAAVSPVCDAEVGFSPAASGSLPASTAGCGLRWYSAISAMAEPGR